MKLKLIALTALLTLALGVAAVAQDYNQKIVPSATAIQYTADGQSLTYLDSTGATITVYYLDSRFAGLLAIQGAQRAATVENIAAVNDYNQKLGDVQGPLDAGKGPANPTAPAKPLKKIVSNTGTVSFVAFDPPLADLVIPKTTPGQVNGPGTGGLTIYDMVLRMYQKMFPGA